MTSSGGLTKRQALQKLFADLEMVLDNWGLLSVGESKDLRMTWNLGLEQQVATVEKFFLPAYKDGKLAAYVASEAGIWFELAAKTRAPTAALQQLQQRFLAKQGLAKDPQFLGQITQVLERICQVIVF